jgi:hypothetical protein
MAQGTPTLGKSLTERELLPGHMERGILSMRIPDRYGPLEEVRSWGKQTQGP